MSENFEYVLGPTNEELSLQFVEKIAKAKILSDEELLVLVKVIPFLPLNTSAIVLSEAIQRVLKK
jgi:hypothetical protein